MVITVALPEDIVKHPDPGRQALELLALEGYRSGALTALQTRALLGFGTRYQFEGFLREHGVWERAYGVEDLQADAETFDRQR